MPPRIERHQLIRRSFAFAAGKADLRLVGLPHTHRVMDEIQRIGDGRSKRLIIMAPPRSGKSLVATELGVAWYAYRHPASKNAICSASYKLAATLSTHARENYERMGGEVGRKATEEHWSTQEGGYTLARGRGQQLSGYGVDGMLVLDDVVSDRAEADSPTVQMRVREWMQSVAFTRLQGDPAIVIINTRWSDADPIGVVMEWERAAAKKQEWRILWLDQEYDPVDRNVPDSCTLVPDWREPGEPLLPAHVRRSDLAHMMPDAIAAAKGLVGSREWTSQQQQRPAPKGGLMFRSEWFQYLPTVPATVGRRVRAWDLAGSKEASADRTAGVRLAQYTTVEGGTAWLVEDVQAGRWTPAERMERIAAVARADGAGVDIVIEQDSGIGGTVRTQQLVAACAPMRVSTVRPTGDKGQRAQPLAAQCEAGNVALLSGGDWIAGFLEETGTFPVLGHDDQVDAAAHAFNHLLMEQESVVEVIANPLYDLW